MCGSSSEVPYSPSSAAWRARCCRWPDTGRPSATATRPRRSVDAGRTVTTVLDEIVAGVREDLAARERRTSLSDVEGAVLNAPPALDAESVLRRPGLSLIAEVKRASPSVGALSDIPDPGALAGAYAAGGAAAVSVLTEGRRFAGSLDDLDAVRGAVEVHDEVETQRAVDAGASVIGVNARNLKTLEIHPDTFSRLRPLIPDQCVTVAESGIAGPEDAAAYAAQGADAVLVGEALVRTGDPRSAAAAIVSAGTATLPRTGDDRA